MRKWFDLILIGLLAINLFRIFSDYSPQTDIMGTTIPTWISVTVQMFCIVILGFKIWKDYAAEKRL